MPTDAEIAEIVEAVARRHGGRERILGLRYEAQADQYVVRGAGVHSNRLRTSIWFHEGSMLRIHVEYPDGVEKRVLYRGEGFMGQRQQDKPSYAKGEWQQNVWWDYKAAWPPKILFDPNVNLRGLAPVAQGEKVLLCLEADNGTRPVVTLLIDPVSAFIVRIEADLPLLTRVMSAQATLRLAQELDDFRDVGGTLFPHRRRLFTDGEQVSLLEFHTLELDPALDESFFVP